MNIIKGDLIQLGLQGRFEVIVHGCNCFCTMGAGIAKQIKTKFPEAYEADTKTDNGNKDKLGNYSSALVARNGCEIIIVNAYTQFDWRGAFNLDYNALEKVFKLIKKDFSGRSIAYPMIGAGLAGGDWNEISKIIEKELKGENHTLVKYRSTKRSS